MREVSLKKGFTLIELLIVVAIIGILAAIAIPNFLEAQTRAKIARVQSDLRTYAIGLEAYYVDWNSYPIILDLNGNWNYDSVQGLIPLSTPVSYLSSSYLHDPFDSTGRALGWSKENADHYIWAYYKWTGSDGGAGWPALTFGDYWGAVPGSDTACVWSLGPSDTHTTPEWAYSMYVQDQKVNANNQIYDPTNGTISAGGIIRYVGVTKGFTPGR